MEARIIKDSQELDGMRSFLSENKLPSQDIKQGDNVFIGYYDENGNLAGSGGLEFYGSHALLRSVALKAAYRGKSHGKEIVTDLLNRANRRSVSEIYLLTETAHDFFLKLGFTDMSREAVPVGVKSSTEFTSVCPSTAKCMMYRF